MYRIRGFQPAVILIDHRGANLALQMSVAAVPQHYPHPASSRML